jgi:hypothetical protein
MKNRIITFLGTLALFLSSVPAVSQNPVVPFRSPRATFTTQTGQPLSGGCIYTYQGGTTTQQATYTDYTGGTANTNPVILDTTGSAVMWLGANSYKFVAYSAGGYHCSSGSLQWTVDQIPGDAFLNGTISGATITNPTITGGTDSGTTISSAVITGSSINSSAIGSSVPASGSFTSVASALQAVTFSSTPVFAASSYGYFTMTLSGNVASSTITGATTGQTIAFQICQNGTGQVVNSQTTGFTFAWPSTYPNAPTINSALNACTVVTAFYNGSNWVTISQSQQVILGNLDTLTFTSTPIFPATNYSNFLLTLTGNATSSTIAGGTIGQVSTFDICEDSTGGRTFVWPSNVLNSPQFVTNAGVCNSLITVYNGTNWNTVASSSTSSTPLTGNLDIIGFTSAPSFNAASYSAFQMTLGGNVTSSSIIGGSTGQLISIALIQGSSTTTAPASAPTVTTSTTGGSLPATTTYYAKCSYLFGVTESLPSAEAYQATGSGSTNSITWTCPAYAGVTQYKFYLGAGTGAEAYYYLTTSTSFVQQNIPSSYTPGSPYGSSIYTVAWPSNLINPPLMATGVGATTALTAVYNGSYWVTVGSSGAGSSNSGPVCVGGNCYRQNPDGSYDEWGSTPTFGGQNGGSFSMAFPHAFTTLSSIQVVFSPNGCDGGNAATCAANPSGSPNNVYTCGILTPSVSAPTGFYSSSNTVTAGASCSWMAKGY